MNCLRLVSTSCRHSATRVFIVGWYERACSHIDLVVFFDRRFWALALGIDHKSAPSFHYTLYHDLGLDTISTGKDKGIRNKVDAKNFFAEVLCYSILINIL